LFLELKRLHHEVFQDKAKQDHVVKEVSRLVKQQKCEHECLEEAKQEKKVVLRRIYTQRDLLRAQLDELEQESRALTARIRAYLASIRGTKKEVTPYQGVFMMPVRGPITSGFGYRMHPILKERRMHCGIDIGAPCGAPISAAAPGVVVEACCSRGYGNKILIDHGGGLMTLYAHCSRIYVGVGQRVKRGERIGAVGATGLVTGPHLHLEVRVNGQPEDPIRFFCGKGLARN
jgi:murein DD-endopeptidase MepM/ murein hydrolase activator NlpD